MALPKKRQSKARSRNQTLLPLPVVRSAAKQKCRTEHAQIADTIAVVRLFLLPNQSPF